MLYFMQSFFVKFVFFACSMLLIFLSTPLILEVLHDWNLLSLGRHNFRSWSFTCRLALSSLCHLLRANLLRLHKCQYVLLRLGYLSMDASGSLLHSLASWVNLAMSLVAVTALAFGSSKLCVVQLAVQFAYKLALRLWDTLTRYVLDISSFLSFWLLFLLISSHWWLSPSLQEAVLITDRIKQVYVSRRYAN